MVVVAQTFNPSIQGAEVGRQIWIWAQPGIETEFQDNQGYTEKPKVSTYKSYIKNSICCFIKVMIINEFEKEYDLSALYAIFRGYLKTN